jgi:hypothetical protein
VSASQALDVIGCPRIARRVSGRERSQADSSCDPRAMTARARPQARPEACAARLTGITGIAVGQCRGRMGMPASMKPRVRWAVAAEPLARTCPQPAKMCTRPSWDARGGALEQLLGIKVVVAPADDQGGGRDARQVGFNIEGVLGVQGDQHVSGSAGTIGPTASRDSGRAGPRSGPGSMTVTTDAHACRGSPARISRAISACSSRPRGPSRYAAETTTSRRTRSGRSTASCSATDPPVLVPSRNTGWPRSCSIALARCPAMSDIDSPGWSPRLRLTT